MDCRLSFGELKARSGPASAAGGTTVLAGSCFTSSVASVDFAPLTFSSMISERRLGVSSGSATGPRPA